MQEIGPYLMRHGCIIFVMKIKASMLEPQNEKSISKRHNILNANVENDFVKQNALALSTLALYHAHQGTGFTVKR